VILGERRATTPVQSSSVDANVQLLSELRNGGEHHLICLVSTRGECDTVHVSMDMTLHLFDKGSDSRIQLLAM